MAIYLGNLKTKEITDRLGIELKEGEFKILDNLRIDNANVPSGRWHCFDIPFQITCGDIEIAKILTDILSPYSDEMKTSIQLVHK